MIGSLTILALLIYSYLFVSPLINWTYRIIWSLALCYIIFACAFGFGGVVNRFLSKPVWHPLSRLSFVAFLIEGMVMTVVSQNRQNFSKIAYVSIQRHIALIRDYEFQIFHLVSALLVHNCSHKCNCNDCSSDD